MSEPENFVARWSRRKQEAERAAEESGAGPREDVVAESAPVEGPAVEAKPSEKKEAEFDLSSLPPIDSIGAGTDIRAFLQRGVPMELSRAALRRAWTTDPAIRDFIEVAENQWDFATGSDIPGFGPLEASDDVRRMVAEVFQGRPEAPPMEEVRPESRAQELAGQQNSQGVAQEAALQNPAPENLSETSLSNDESIVQREEKDIATQQDEQNSESDPPIKRAHGGALPR